MAQFKDKKAEQVYFENLPVDYKKQQHPVLDSLWWNESLQSSISYFSTCSKVSRSLESFQASSYPSKYKRISVSKTDNSLYSLLEISQSDSEKIYMSIYTIKKKDCYFNINLVAGSIDSFNKQEPLFKKFIKSFNYQ